MTRRMDNVRARMQKSRPRGNPTKECECGTEALQLSPYLSPR